MNEIILWEDVRIDDLYKNRDISFWDFAIKYTTNDYYCINEQLIAYMLGYC